MSLSGQVRNIPRGKYEVLGKVAAGGMGEVFKVRHRILGEVRAIKVMRDLLATDRNLRHRFLKEARTAAALRHRNLAQIYDASLGPDGAPHLVLEWVEGLDLGRLLSRAGPLPVPQALEIAAQTLNALGYLHRRGFVHRDVSPDNLMLTRSQEGGLLVKVIDLGIAKSLKSQADLTRRGQFVGKFRYAAPEILADRQPKPDPRSDLYSFAIVLYQLLTGAAPIEGESEAEIVSGHLFKDPRPFEVTDPAGRVPQTLRAIVMKGLEKNPDARFQSASEFAAALAEVASPIESPGSWDWNICETTVALETRPFDPARRASDQERLDRTFSLDSSAEADSDVLDRPAQRAGRERGHEHRHRPGLTSTLKRITQRYPKRLLLGSLAVVALASITVAGLLSGGESRKVVSHLPEIEAHVAPDIERTTQSETPELVTESRNDEADDSQAGNGVSSTAATPTTLPLPQPENRELTLISSSPPLSSAVVGALGAEFEIVVRDSLAQARASSVSHLALRVSAEMHRLSLTAYETQLPACEATATGELIRLPSASILISRTRRQTAPRCGEALHGAAASLVEELVPHIRAARLGGIVSEVLVTLPSE